MEKLIAYLNSLSTDDQVRFADSCGTSVGYFRKAASVGQKIGAEICVSAERESGNAVTRRDLRPDDWHLIWPELITDIHPTPQKVLPAECATCPEYATCERRANPVDSVECEMKLKKRKSDKDA